MFLRLEYENEAYMQGKTCIVGLDEAGRGPMAGPLVVGAVIFEKGYGNDAINDSKTLSEKKREELYDIIIRDALDYAIVVMDEEEVDQLNVYRASQTGMIRAIQQLKLKPDYALTDAMPLGDVIEHQAIIKGDSQSLSIGAASILAKVTRDRIMNKYDKLYPQYNFKKHKGYPTKEHKELLKQYGACPIHRKSFKPVMEVLNEQLTLDI